jgi:hypothetical protein
MLTLPGPFHHRQRCHGRPVTPQEIDSNLRGYVLHIKGRLADSLVAAPAAALTLARKAGGWLFRSPLGGPPVWRSD